MVAAYDPAWSMSVSLVDGRKFSSFRAQPMKNTVERNDCKNVANAYV